MKRLEIDDLLSKMPKPVAPDGLKQRALSAARQARFHTVRRSLEDVLWNSTALRLAWTGAVIVLLAINLTLGSPPSPGPVGRGRVKQASWVIAMDLESILVNRGRKGPTAAEVLRSLDELLCDQMPDCNG